MEPCTVILDEDQYYRSEAELHPDGWLRVIVYYRSVIEETLGQWVQDPEAGVSLGRTATANLRALLTGEWGTR